MPFCCKDVPSEAASTIKATKPEKDWPEKGEVKFSKYKMRYRKNLPLALKGIGFTIKAREKVGIVGRSGSGEFLYDSCIETKSAFMLHFAVYEISTADLGLRGSGLVTYLCKVVL